MLETAGTLPLTESHLPANFRAGWGPYERWNGARMEVGEIAGLGVPELIGLGQSERKGNEGDGLRAAETVTVEKGIGEEEELLEASWSHQPLVPLPLSDPFQAREGFDLPRPEAPPNEFQGGMRVFGAGRGRPVAQAFPPLPAQG